ncbi:cytochrome-c peroxidase [Adhaeretor mobilis]|uniref:Cytochrome c551 peroxidase n=1 Tax=Adhaeretor mobilis TaxID=1930276 RepID=A0A517N2S9_9BACT|nr:cytochrome c peroxidase [Adhaeretor mobilis]QDT01433.1 Cytochrome c551 peroxidase precursor [Adhaeretor mobilis]
MGRLIVIVLVLLAVAFLVNKYIIQGGDAPPKEFVEEMKQEAEQESLAKEPSESETEESTEPTARVLAEVGEESEPAKDVEKVMENEPELELKSETESSVEEVIAKPQAEPETILLGTDELYDGIPGEGVLTLDQVKMWLADPDNHVTLDPELPLGLKAGAGEIKGLKENPLTRAKIELGRQLFFDPRISSDNSISCASCHHPDFGYGKDTQFGVGVDGQTGNRNSPVAYNRILSDKQFWDGRAATLEEQAIGPIANPIEMGNTHEATVADLKTVPEYVAQFEAVFGDGEGDDAVEIDNAAKALAAFERALVTGPTPWDYHLEIKSLEEGFEIEEEYLDELKEEEPEVYEEYMALKALAEKSPLSESARRGGELFFSEKGGCTACHFGANFTDEKYHNLGVGFEEEMADEDRPADFDWGRFTETNEDLDRGAFKTPTVRNIASTGPYMHDGSQETLEEVIEWYAKGGHKNPYLSENVKKLDLSEQDKKDLVNFLKEGLHGELPKVEEERLPAGAEEAQEEAEEAAEQ